MTSAVGTATIVFGSSPGANEASIAVTGQSAIATGAKCEAYVMGDDSTSDHTANDHKYFAMLCTLICGNSTAGTGFTIYARSQHKLTGTFQIRWVWLN